MPRMPTSEGREADVIYAEGVARNGFLGSIIILPFNEHLRIYVTESSDDVDSVAPFPLTSVASCATFNVASYY
jgi:hypothetical protein